MHVKWISIGILALAQGASCAQTAGVPGDRSSSSGWQPAMPAAQLVREVVSNELNDHSTNLWALADVSLGENWHNIHHAHPTWARHGAGRGMVDPSARLIRVFETFGWVSKVRWPTKPLPGASVIPA